MSLHQFVYDRGYFYSTDMISWEFIVTSEIESNSQEAYAPAAVVAGNAILWMTSGDGKVYRSTDPKNGRWTLDTLKFPQRETDPSLLWDNGRLYWYGGCSSTKPLWGVEIDPVTYAQIGKRVVVVESNVKQLGWERRGDTNRISKPPWLEGSFPLRINSTYFLEASVPGTQYKTYCSVVYTSPSPLGPFRLQADNPLTIKAGGFVCGAGHGSTYADAHGNLWHASTASISVRHMFERRLQIHPLFLDPETGVLWGYTGWGDWPKRVPTSKVAGPGDMDTGSVLLSYGKRAEASSTLDGYPVAHGVDENIRTWWSATDGAAGQWYAVDLGAVCTVSGVQVNFADQDAALFGRPTPPPPLPHTDGDGQGHGQGQGVQAEGKDIGVGVGVCEGMGARTCVGTNTGTGIYYRYVLEGSVDGVSYEILADYSTQTADHPHQYTDLTTDGSGTPCASVLPRAAAHVRYVRAKNVHTPDGRFSLSGLRVFGVCSTVAKPAVAPANVTATREADRRGVVVRWTEVPGAAGYNIRFGTGHRKMYQNHMVYGGGTTRVELYYLNAALQYVFAVDTYNEGGVTLGTETAEA